MVSFRSVILKGHSSNLVLQFHKTGKEASERHEKKVIAVEAEIYILIIQFLTYIL